MHDEQLIERLFRDAREDIADDGFSRGVMRRIEMLRRARRWVLGTAAVAGATIATPPLVHVVFDAGFNAVLPHIGAPVVDVVAMCATALALWFFCVSVES